MSEPTNQPQLPGFATPSVGPQSCKSTSPGHDLHWIQSMRATQHAANALAVFDVRLIDATTIELDVFDDCLETIVGRNHRAADLFFAWVHYGTASFVKVALHLQIGSQSGSTVFSIATKTFAPCVVSKRGEV